MKKQYFFYILSSSENSYCTGTTTDLKTREIDHNNVKGANYIRIRYLAHLAYYETFDVFEDAVRRERQVKRWSRAKKKALIKGDVGKLKKTEKEQAINFLLAESLPKNEYRIDSGKIQQTFQRFEIRFIIILFCHVNRN